MTNLDKRFIQQMLFAAVPGGAALKRVGRYLHGIALVLALSATDGTAVAVEPGKPADLPEPPGAVMQRYIDFENEADLKTLYAGNKELYFKLVKVLRDIRSVPAAEIPAWLEAEHGATYGSVSPSLWKLSYPPMNDIDFELDGIHFFGTMALTGFSADVLYWNQPNRP